MKKITKILSLLLVVIMLVTLLSGCKKLDVKRQNQAFWNNKKHTEIVLDGKIYSPLKPCEYFCPDYNIGVTGCYVTKKDVPVLLSRFFGVDYSITNDKEIINVNGMFFARNDVTDKYEKLLNNYKLDCLSTYTTVYDDNTGEHQKAVLFTEKETKIINTALLSAKDYTSKEDDYWENYLSVNSADKSLLFIKLNFDMYYKDGDKEIIIFKEDKYYSLSSEYTVDLLAIMKKYSEK